MQHPTYKIPHTTTFVTPVVEHGLEREIAQWVHPMKDRSDDPSHQERTLLPRSYISLSSMLRSEMEVSIVKCPSSRNLIKFYKCVLYDITMIMIHIILSIQMNVIFNVSVIIIFCTAI